MSHMQADNAEAEAGKTTRAEDRAAWMDGLLDKENQMTLLGIVALVLAGLAFRHFVIGDIPEGYEDENGFHLGRKK